MALSKRGTKQQEILAFIERYTSEYGYPPTVREICAGVGLSSTSTVHGHLSRMEKKGLIQKSAFKNRAISSTGVKSNSSIGIPIVGVVTAGRPILAHENFDGYFPIPKGYFKGDEHFILDVKGDSMINAGIYDGDRLIVNRVSSAENGEIVVALIDDEATVKRFFKENGHIRLQPENPAMEPIIAPSAVILGKVAGLVRKFG
ncbi:MAG: transcriptional repressor LexA [Christensenellales bacterium]